MRRSSLILTGLLLGIVLTPIVVSAATDTDGSVYKPRPTQCVLFDTRKPTPVPVEADTIRSFSLQGDLTSQGGEAGCFVDVDATGYHLNLVALNPQAGGNLKAWPAGQSEPNGGIVNYQGLTPNLNNSNAFMVPNDPDGLKVKANKGTVHVRGILYGELFTDGVPRSEFDALVQRVDDLEARVEALEPGACVEGNPCDDGNACTVDDTCTAGVCTGTPRVCADGNACTDDGCNPETGCVFTPANGRLCDDGNACTDSDVCVAGDCTPGPPLDCSDGNPCTEDSCNPSTGCSSDPSAGTPCNDGNACTEDDSCDGTGSCIGGPPRDCSDDNPCTADSCNSSLGCTNPVEADGTPCGDACSQGTVCEAGACSPGTPLDCNDDNSCTDDSCHPDTGCQNDPLQDGAPCNDGDECTLDDECVDGLCDGAPDPGCDPLAADAMGCV